jgi:capsular exopolysaccharide synthesis family protein
MRPPQAGFTATAANLRPRNINVDFCTGSRLRGSRSQPRLDLGTHQCAACGAPFFLPMSSVVAPSRGPVSAEVVEGAAALSNAADPAYRYTRPEEREVSLRDLIDVVIRGRWIILSSVIALLVPSALYTFLQDPVYQSSALLLVQTKDESLSDVLPTDPRELFLKTERNLSNELLVLRESDALADSAAVRLLRYGSRGAEGGTVLTILEPPRDEALTQEHVVDRLQTEYVTAAMAGDDVDAIRVTVSSTVPEEAVLIANLYAEEFVRLTQESSRAGVTASRDFLEDQVAEQQIALQGLDDQVRDFMVREGAAALDQETASTVSQLAELEAQRDETAIEIRMKQAEVTALEGELAAIEPRLVEFVASGVQHEIEAAQGRIAELEGRLEQIYLRNPELRDAADPPESVAELQQQVHGLRSRVRELSARYLEEAVPIGVNAAGGGSVERVSSLRRQLVEGRIALSGLQARHDVLRARIGEYEGELRAIPAQAIDLAQMQRRRQSTERLYLALEEKLQEARVAEESELGYSNIVSRARIPEEPVSPRPLLNLSVGLLFGLSVGVGLALLRANLDHRIHRPDDLRTRGYTLLGTVPNMAELIQNEFGGAKTIEVEGRALDTGLVTLLNPMAVASEAYRALRTSIQFSRPDAVIETVLVTSSLPSEGKSNTAANLAVAMAQADRRVLLIDADLRRPRVHRIWGAPREPGLADLLFASTPIEIEQFRTPVDNLYVLPAGRTVPNPAELLGSKAMRELLEGFREAFDVVIIDSPPVGAATDAVLLSTQCDATIVVVGAGTAKDFDIEYSMESLRGVGARIIGTVLNKFDLSQAYGYKYKYKYRYGSLYGYGPEKHPT